MALQSQESCHSGAESYSLKINDLERLEGRRCQHMRHVYAKMAADCQLWRVEEARAGIRRPNTSMGITVAAQ
jgi:hypothetical protein